MGERKKGKNEKLLNGKAFEINPKGMKINQDQFFSDFHDYAICFVGSLEGKHFKNVPTFYITFHNSNSNCSILRVKTMLKKRDIN